MNLAYNYLSRSTVLLLILCLGVGLKTSLAQQSYQSDYQIKHQFKVKYDSLSQELDSVDNVTEANNVLDGIRGLEENYKDHRQLLDKVLYPETFTGKMKKIEKRSHSIISKLKVIKTQNTKLETLNQKLATYDQHFENLVSRSDSLRRAIEKSNQSEKKLSGMVRSYRRSLEKRDQFIMSVIDSLFATYGNMSNQALKDLRNKKSRQINNGNALNMVKSIAQNNIDFLNSNPTLSTQDYLRMYVVQKNFSSMWDKVGPKLIAVYSGKQNQEDVKQVIDNDLSKWQTKVANYTWKSLNNSFDEENINVPEFGDSQGFYNSLNGYLTTAIKKSKENGGEKAQKQYQKFASFWNNIVKTKWAQYMAKGNILDYTQIASIDQKVDQWSKVSQPESHLMAILLGLSVLANLALGVVLIRVKSSSSENNNNRKVS